VLRLHYPLQHCKGRTTLLPTATQYLQLLVDLVGHSQMMAFVVVDRQQLNADMHRLPRAVHTVEQVRLAFE
jgi:hypothetical protein